MMPESERDGAFDSDEEYPWDLDLGLPLDPDESDSED